ncbi:MAG: rRNA adenine N(6)-methyltransferase family protein, partial [Oscillospiraceae bacterium]|nr:rRNA adenine N(6)-methyltransferase family protein [Oscillospiraceae bacterium]
MPQSRKAAIRLAQNFLTSSAVINRIIRLSSLSKNDTVVEIGSGKGHITGRLIERCGYVYAVEYDRNLYAKLEYKFGGAGNIKLLNLDFLEFNLPKAPYKVFANIPFNLTTEIVRKLNNPRNAPAEAWLVMEKGAAKRFMGKPFESVMSLLIKPFFDTEIVYHFCRNDFHPAPSVECVLFHLKQKEIPDIKPSEVQSYSRFVNDCTKSASGIHAYL